MIDTPETHGGIEPFGPEASEANRQLVEGKTVRLEKDVSETDQFGRLLRYVYVGDVMVNEELLRQMWGQPMIEQPTPAPPPATSGYTGPYDPNGPDRDCGDFATHAEAQAFYEAAGGPGTD